MKWFPSILLILLLITGCESLREKEKLEIELEKIRTKYAPDSRTDRFEVQLNKENDSYYLEGYTTSLEAHEALKKEAESSSLTVIDQLVIYPDSTIGVEKWGIVNVSVCNIRSEPRFSAELATQELMGNTLQLLTRNGDWYLVRTPNRYLGWLHEGAMIRLTSNEYDQWKTRPKRVIPQSTGWIFNEPDPTSAVVSDIVAGAVVIDRQESGNGFAGVELPDGRQGFVLELSSLEESGSGGDELVQTARQFLGVPYLWGGTSAKAFDCSGYTKTIFALHGFLLPRDASQQVLVGKLIETDKTWKNLKKGDLLFFGTYRDDGSERITHVAMYLGNGKIIHATGLVKIQSLNPNDPDFARDRYDTFIKAKRMVENEKPQKGVLALTY